MDAEQRFTRLFRADYQRVLRFVARRAGADAEDLTAEVFRIAWARAVDGEAVTSAWLFVTARNVLSNHGRSVARGEVAYRRAAVADATGVVDERVAEIVGDVLERLPDGRRAVLIHKYWDELSAGEIAALTGVSTAAVWVRLHRARQAFKGTFQQITEAGHVEG